MSYVETDELGRDGSTRAASLGKRLKLLRTRAGLSQRELARRADMTNGALSNIEQGKVSPSVLSLEKILSAIPISLQEFFSDERDLSPSVFRRSDLAKVNQNDTEYLVLSLGEVDHAAVYLTQQSYAPGALVSSEWMVHRGRVAGMVMAGVLELELDGVEYSLTEGDGFHFSIQRPHSFRNAGSEICVVVSVSLAA